MDNSIESKQINKISDDDSDKRKKEYFECISKLSNLVWYLDLNIPQYEDNGEYEEIICLVRKYFVKAKELLGKSGGRYKWDCFGIFLILQEKLLNQRNISDDDTISNNEVHLFNDFLNEKYDEYDY
jgi:hypothetical protein